MAPEQHLSYYDDFYGELARVDATGNDFAKIAALFEDAGGRAALRVADIGCGYGSVSRTLAQMGHRVYGMEVGRAALAGLPALGIRAVRSDITRSLPLADESVDVALLLDVLEHVFNPLSLIAEARRVLRPSGRLIISVPLYFDLLDRLRILFTGSVVSYDNHVYGRTLAARFRSYNYDHIRFFRPSEVREMLNISGFSITRSVFIPFASSFKMFPIGLTLRTLARSWPSLFAHSMRVSARKV